MRHPRTVALAADPARPARLALVALLALAALIVPRLAPAHPLLAAPIEIVASGTTARVLVETEDERAVTIEWGTAPYASRVTRSSPGRSHAVALRGLIPGQIYVYSVRVNGMRVGKPQVFVMPGAPAKVPHAPAAHAL